MSIRKTLEKALAPILIAAWVTGLPGLHAATVYVQLVDGESGETTPAMVCISGADGSVRLPPDGRKLLVASTTREYKEGVLYSPDPNWIGPVRKMSGLGDNDDRSFVYETLLSIPYWKEPFMYQASGDFSIQLPPGRWRLAVDRGMEHIPVVKVFEIPDERPVEIQFTLQRWIDLPAEGWWSGDVHVHHPTREPGHRDYLLSYARATDLHLVNVLEMGHHEGTEFHQAGFGPAFRIRDGRYWLVSGQEEPRSQFGHIIGLNMSSLARDLPTYDFYDLAFQRIHAQPGALVGYAHLSWNGCDLPRGFPWYVTTEALDFVELLQFSKINCLDYYEYLNLGFRLTAAAGSDIPWGSVMGEVRTFVHTGDTALDPNAWFAGLKAGHSYVSNGPALDFLVDGNLPGSVLPVEPGQSVRVTARVRSHPAIGIPERLELVGNRGVIQAVENPGKETRLEIDLDLDVSDSMWLAVSTVCDNKAVAHTTPVYLEVNGRPTWCPVQGPEIIEKQLAAINKIGMEFAAPEDSHGWGVLQRLARAREYYRTLLEAMGSP